MTWEKRLGANKRIVLLLYYVAHTYLLPCICRLWQWLVRNCVGATRP
jgi:hypothetical protein